MGGFCESISCRKRPPALKERPDSVCLKEEGDRPHPRNEDHDCTFSRSGQAEENLHMHHREIVGVPDVGRCFFLGVGDRLSPHFPC